DSYGRVPSDILLVAVERMPRQVKAERLALTKERLFGPPRLDHGIVLDKGRVGRRQQAEQAGLPGGAVALARRALIDRRFDHGNQRRTPLPLRHRVEGTSADQPLERALVELPHVDAATHLEDGLEGPLFTAGLDDGVDGVAPDVAHAPEPESDR